jgi:Lon protease-like protein
VPRLPIFPLGTVLVPGQILSLNIFEPRYRRLAHDLVEKSQPERVFGVVAIKAGHEVGDPEVAVHTTGTLAQVRQLSCRPDGTIGLIASGAQRFTVLTLVDAPTPYLVADIDVITDTDDDDDAVAVALADRVAAAFCAVLDAAGAPLVTPPTPATALSYFVAVNTPLELCEQQRLLAEPTTIGRLRAEIDILRREQHLLGTLGAPAKTGPWQAPTPN